MKLDGLIFVSNALLANNSRQLRGLGGGWAIRKARNHVFRGGATREASGTDGMRPTSGTGDEPSRGRCVDVRGKGKQLCWKEGPDARRWGSKAAAARRPEAGGTSHSGAWEVSSGALVRSPCDHHREDALVLVDLTDHASPSCHAVRSTPDAS